jgi:hypothetical protein
MFADSPDLSRCVFAGVVFVPKCSRYGLNHKDEHFGVASRGHAGEIEKNGKDHDGAYKTAEQYLEACAGKQGGGEQRTFDAHDGERFV